MIQYKNDSEYMMRCLVRWLGSQKEVAKSLGRSKQIFNYWFNHSDKMPLNDFIKMESLFLKIKLLKELETHEDGNSVQNDGENTTVIFEKIIQPQSAPFLERVQLAMSIESKIGQRKGRPSGEILKNKCARAHFHGKTGKWLAKHFDLKSLDTYRRAKKIILLGIPALIEAVDRGDIHIYRGSFIAEQNPEFQKQLLSESLVKVNLKNVQQQP